jgi:hypothetical protein
VTVEQPPENKTQSINRKNDLEKGGKVFMAILLENMCLKGQACIIALSGKKSEILTDF